MPSPVSRLEDVAYDIWCAPEVEELDGWRLRFAHGLTGRANSVWPNRAGRLPLQDKIERAEAWYRERGLPARFQVTEAAESGLAEALVARGYRQPAAPVSVQTTELPARAQGDGGHELVSTELDDTWLAFWAESRSFNRPDVVRALLTGGPGTTGFARIDDVAIGRGVVVGDWVGITAMVTVPEARRRGHARVILEALLQWARGLQAKHAILQVEEGNTAAERLYASAGFTPSHSYRYSIQP